MPDLGASSQELKILGLIPARGGSKSVPRKNLRMLAGLPLVAHSIREALRSSYIKRTVCSTDSPEIAEVARRYGAEVPFLRPAELATDTSTDADFAVHAIQWLRDHEGWMPDVVVILWPTCPFRRASDIDGAVRTLLDHPDADSVVSVVPPRKSPYKMWRCTDEGYLVPLLTSHVFEQFAGPRQRLPGVLAPNGYVHIVRAETVLRSSSILGLKVLPYEMDARDHIDIDSEEDLRTAEMLVHNHWASGRDGPQAAKARKRIRVTDGRWIGDGETPFIIAEIGNNHNGSMEIAQELVRQAKEAGCDAVKFQKKDIATAFSEELLNRPYAGPNSFGKTYREHKEHLELSREQLRYLKQLADELGLISFATPFDAISVEDCKALGYPLYKIASFHVTNLDLIKRVCETGKPLIVSTGMSSLQEIDAAVELIRRYTEDFVLLQCTSTYPSEVEDSHLRVIPALRERYGCLVGYSDHERGVSIAPGTVLLGGCVIERHFTLDRAMKGPDHAASAEPEGMALLVRRARNFYHALGSPNKEVLPCELANRKKFRYE